MLIKGEKISKIYDMGEIKVKALLDADFEINKEEFLVILGPSGSGKSTLLNIIGGMDKLTSGILTYNNKIISKLDSKDLTLYRRNNIGFVFQFYNLMPNLTAYENIELAHQIAKDPLSIDEVLKDVGLYERKNHFPSQLSGGEQQRIALARALVKNPDVLLCDEPTGALDSKTSKEVLKILYKFLKKYKKTVIIITHNSEIGKIANRVFYLKDGKIKDIVTNENPISIDEVVL